MVKIGILLALSAAFATVAFVVRRHRRPEMYTAVPAWVYRSDLAEQLLAEPLIPFRFPWSRS